MVLLCFLFAVTFGAQLRGRLSVVAKLGEPARYFLNSSFPLQFGSTMAPSSVVDFIEVDTSDANASSSHVTHWRTLRKRPARSKRFILPVRIILAEVSGTRSSCSPEQAEFLWSVHQWGVRNYFLALNDAFDIRIDSIVSATLPGSYPKTSDFSQCRVLVEDAVALTQTSTTSASHTIILISNSGTDCGQGASLVGCAGSQPCWYNSIV